MIYVNRGMDISEQFMAIYWNPLHLRTSILYIAKSTHAKNWQFQYCTPYHTMLSPQYTVSSALHCLDQVLQQNHNLQSAI